MNNKIEVQKYVEGMPIRIHGTLDEILDGKMIEIHGPGLLVRADLFERGVELTDLTDAYSMGRTCRRMIVECDAYAVHREILYSDIRPFLALWESANSGSHDRLPKPVALKAGRVHFEVSFQTLEAAQVFPSVDRLPPPLSGIPRSWDDESVVAALANRQVAGCWSKINRGPITECDPLDVAFDLVQRRAELVRIRSRNRDPNKVSLRWRGHQTICFDFSVAGSRSVGGLQS